MKLIIQKGRARTDAKAPIIPLRAFEGLAHIDKTGKLSFASSQANISLFMNYAPETEIVEISEGIFNALESDAGDVPKRPKFKMRREARFWQAEAVRKIEHLIVKSKADDIRDRMAKAFALFYRPGGGKSKSLVDMAMMLWCANEIDACIILPPNLLVAEQWVSDHGALATDIQEDVVYASWLWGKTRAAQKDYKNLKSLKPHEGIQFISMNIDAAKTPKGRELLADFIRHHRGRVLFAIDESHLIKTTSSGRHKACADLGSVCEWRAILTGTPIAKNLVDAWAQFKFLDERIIGYRFVTAFKNRFCIERFNGFANEVIGHKDIDELYRRIEPYSARVSEEEMGLKKVRDEFEFRLDGDQKRHFDEVKKQWLTSLDDGEFATATIALTAAVKMHQITSGFVKTDEGKTHVFKDNARMNALLALLETLDDDKLVIWCRFRQNAQDVMTTLEKKFGKGSAVEISGNIDKKLKSSHKEKFIYDEKVRWLVATTEAAGTGMDGLQSVCNRAIFYNTSENFVNRIQAEDRVLRLGGETTSFYHDLVSKGSGDRKILQNLWNKRDLSRMSLDEVRKIFE